MSEELPGGGTSQISGASQTAAAPSAEAAPQSAASKLYQPAANPAAQQQASAGKEPVSTEVSRAKGEGAQAPKVNAEYSDVKASNGETEESSGERSVAGEAQAESTAEGAPEKYEFKPVEGVNLSEEVVGKFSEVARELNLTRDAAQKMLDQVAPAIARQQHAAIQKLSNEWVSAVKADKEIGGDKLGANLAIAKKARDAFGTDGLRKLLNESRIGNHPEVIRFFVRAGQAISEDTFVSGGTRPASGGKDAATVLYGKQH
jgi:hypothetical protein